MQWKKVRHVIVPDLYDVYNQRLLRFVTAVTSTLSLILTCPGQDSPYALGEVKLSPRAKDPRRGEPLGENPFFA